MPDNLLETLQRLIQDVIAPDVRELKVRVSEMEKRMDARFEALERQNEAQFKAIMAAISESKAQSDLTALREVAALRERVAVLESRPH